MLNAITEQQKQRVREVFSLYERYLGVRFVETAALGMTIVKLTKALFEIAPEEPPWVKDVPPHPLEAAVPLVPTPLPRVKPPMLRLALLLAGAKGLGP